MRRVSGLKTFRGVFCGRVRRQKSTPLSHHLGVGPVSTFPHHGSAQASLTMKCLIPFFFFRQYCTHIAEILDVKVMNVKNDPFGQIESGHIRIRAPSQEVCSCHIPENFFDCQPISLPEVDPDNGHENDMVELCKGTCRPYESSVEVLQKRPCCKVPAIHHEALLFLHISSTRDRMDKSKVRAHGLILRRKNQHENEFQRIGRGVFLETVRTSEIWTSCTLTIF